MIFDEGYNTIVNLMMDMDDEFSDVFSEFVRSLPRSIVSKCKKNITKKRLRFFSGIHKKDCFFSFGCCF